MNDIIPFYEKFVVPATKRARENTKYDFHAGYNKACGDMVKRFKEHGVEMVRK